MSDRGLLRGETLWERWRANADEKPEAEAIVHLTYGEPARRWHWAELLTAALGYAEDLRARGVRPGEVCALIIRHHADFYPLYLGVVATGALPAVLAYPNDRIHPDKFRQGISGMLARSGLHWVLTEEALLPTLEPFMRPAQAAASTLKGILTPLAATASAGSRSLSPLFTPEAASPNAPCLLQHSSGTTGLQKAVMLSHRAILGHVERYARSLDLREDDKVVSWLPLYHDMGLIAAFHLPLAAAIPAVHLSPFEWVAAPVLLLEALSEERGTLSWLPNFAYNLIASRAHDDDIAALDLSSVRMLINCSEPIQARSHERFAARFAARGLGPDKLAGCYAMAETTFAVTQTRPGQEAVARSFDREALSRGVVTLAHDPDRGRVCVSSGKPVDDCSIRIVDETGEDRGEAQVGEILVRSASLFEGYRNDPERTAASFTDGWYRTGDLGFLHEGELFVAGRRKDIIIVAGRNLAPEDIEAVASEVPGILPGRVVAFGVLEPRSGTEEVWVAAETEAEDAGQLARLRDLLVRAAMTIDVSVARCVLVPPRWLIKSSSGKLSRALNKERALEREGATS